MNLSTIYANHVAKEEKERDQYRLFVSDVGKCPRMAGYRMIGQQRDAISEQSHLNKLIMFDLAEYMERTLYWALIASGQAIAYQDDVEFPDRENWGGRLDIIAGYPLAMTPRIIEVKTLHPNAFRYGIDYEAHRQQASVYHIYCEEKYGLSLPPLLVYFDRGGTNTPQEQEVNVDKDHTLALMDELERARDKAYNGKLPARASKVLKVRDAGKSIKLEPSPDCRYCDWQGTCVPHMGKEVWATRVDVEGPWQPTKKAKPDMLEAFADRMVSE